MSVTIEDLPPEIFLNIFEYLSPEELINVQYVCTKWREFAQTSSVWDEFVYSPDRDNTTTEDMITFLEKCPMLKHIHTDVVPDKDEFIPAVLKYCFDIHSFCVQFIPTLSEFQVDDLFNAFPNLHCFQIRVERTDTTQIVARLSKCTKLKKLILNGHYCIDGVFKPIVDGCIALEYLSFNGGFPNVSKSDLLYVLKNMNERLLYLQFGFSPITQDVVNLLGTFTKLEKLSLHDATHGRQTVDFSPITKIKTLKSLKLESYAKEKIKLDMFLEFIFFEPFPVLEKLSIRSCHCKYDKTVLKNICQSYPKLKNLHLYGHHPDDIKEGFKDLCMLEGLESLGFPESDTITDDDIAHVGQCRKLKNLDLHRSNLLTDRMLIHLANCKNLESLDLSYSSISGYNLHLIADNLNRLKFLDVKQCKNLQIPFVCALADKMPTLKIVTTGGVCFV